MKKFLVLYKSSATAQQQMAGASPEQMQAGMDAWRTWATAAQPYLVDLGAPLGDPFASTAVRSGPVKPTSPGTR